MDAVIVGAVVLGAAVLGAALEILGSRARRRRRERMSPFTPGTVKGDRPSVMMHVDEVTYDLTETGVRVADSADGKAVWEFTIAAARIPEGTKTGAVTIPVLPPDTSIHVNIKGER